MNSDLGSIAKDLPRRGGADSAGAPSAFSRRRIGEDADACRSAASDPRAAFAEPGMDLLPGAESRAVSDADGMSPPALPARASVRPAGGGAPRIPSWT